MPDLDIEQIYKGRVDCMPDWIWDIDHSGIYTFSNSVLESMLGYCESEIIGRHVSDFLAQEDTVKFSLALTQALETREPVRNFIHHTRTKDGILKTLESSFVPIYDNGQLAGFRGISRDIIGELIFQRAAREALARHEIRRYCEEHGLKSDRLDTFMLGVGEAITNGIKHAAICRVYAGVRNDCVWVGVADKGPGIEALVLPQSILQRGFSTKISMGLGYSIMLEVADNICLKTDEHGTVVILAKMLVAPAAELSINQLPDTWEIVSTNRRAHSA